MRILSGLLAAVALIGCTGALTAQTQDTPSVDIIAPFRDSVIAGNPVEIAVRFTATQQQPVTSVQIYLDGAYITQMRYDPAEVQATATFKWDTTRTPNGPHKLDAQLFCGEQYVGTASTTVTVSNGRRDLAPPRVAVTSPKDGSVVSGVIPIIIAASDEGGREPMVSIYVDKTLKCVRNRAPYTYDWDTRGYSNGAHVIEAHAEDDASNSSFAKTISVMVRNESSQPIMIQSPVEQPKMAATASTTTPGPLRSEPKEAARATSAAGAFEVGQTPLTKVKPTSGKGSPASAPTPVAEEPIPAQKAVVIHQPQPDRVEEKRSPTWKPGLSMETKTAPTGVLIAKAELEFEAPMLPPPAPQAKPEVRADSSKVYVVKSGDCIDVLARRLGVPSGTLIAMNDLKNPAMLQIGQKLRVPGSDTKLVAIRPIFEEAGGTLSWSGGKTKRVHAVCPEHDVVLKIGSSSASVDSRSVKMAMPAVLNAGRTMVAESFVTRTLGMSVSGD